MNEAEKRANDEVVAHLTRERDQLDALDWTREGA
jgi:hypothetical protein